MVGRVLLIGAFNPFEKYNMLVKMGSSPPIFGVKIKPYLIPPPSR